MESIIKTTFEGSNQEYEIETIEEFEEKVGGLERDPQSGKKALSGWVLQQVDLSKMEQEVWAFLDWSKATLWGCLLPSYTSKLELEQAGASVVMQPRGLPFLPIRAHMYRNPELQARDKAMYKWYKEEKDIKCTIMQSMHDFSIRDALYDYLEGKSVIVVMGGHAVSRASPDYAVAAKLGYLLAQAGLVVATGGGPGSMEATNLGAYMCHRSEDELEDALQMMALQGGERPEHEYLDTETPQRVIEKYGVPTWQASLGFPTFFYGHEPPSLFPSWHAKMFSNAVREDGLIAIGNAGIVYFPGAAGTRQEVFQAACRNHYSESGEEIPMIFYGSEFWDKSLIFSALEVNSRGRPMAGRLAKTDSVMDVVQRVRTFVAERGLPLHSQADLEREYLAVYPNIEDAWKVFWAAQEEAEAEGGTKAGRRRPSPN